MNVANFADMSVITYTTSSFSSTRVVPALVTRCQDFQPQPKQTLKLFLSSFRTSNSTWL